jgi:hypothetical protein
MGTLRAFCQMLWLKELSVSLWLVIIDRSLTISIDTTREYNIKPFVSARPIAWGAHQFFAPNTR